MKLPALNSGKVIRILEKKGFVPDRVQGSHHIYIHPEGRQRVVIPVHKKDLPKGILKEIRKQAGIPKEEPAPIFRIIRGMYRSEMAR